MSETGITPTGHLEGNGSGQGGIDNGGDGAVVAFQKQVGEVDRGAIVDSGVGLRLAESELPFDLAADLSSYAVEVLLDQPNKPVAELNSDRVRRTVYDVIKIKYRDAYAGEPPALTEPQWRQVETAIGKFASDPQWVADNVTPLLQREDE